LTYVNVSHNISNIRVNQIKTGIGIGGDEASKGFLEKALSSQEEGMKKLAKLAVGTLVLATLGGALAQTNPTLELWTWSPGSKAWYEAIGPKCGVNIKITQTNIVQHHDRLRISLQSGGVGAPDLTEVEQGRFGAFIRGEGDIGLLDLAPWFREVDPKGELVEARKLLFAWRGKYYGAPVDLTPVVFYYRADIWEAADVDPQKLNTWTEWVAGARKVVAANPGSVAMPVFPFLHQALMRQRSSDLFDGSGNLLVDTNLSIEIFSWMADLVKQGLAAPILGPLHVPNQPEDYAQFRNGKWLGVVGADWYSGFLKNNIPELAGKWKATQLPAWGAGGRRITTLGGGAIAIPKTGKNVEAALKFVQCALFTPDNLVTNYQINGIFPTFSVAWKDPRFQVPDPYFGNQRLGALFAQLAPRTPRQFQSPYRSLTQEKILASYRAVLSGQVSAADMLKKVAAEVRDEIRRDRR
jgi:ABC-type glycerol-3-phosphate transport system substrate-binding protein